MIFFKGGLSGSQNNSAPLTAFTLIALLEMNEIIPKMNADDASSVLSNELIDQSLACLSLESGTPADPYTTALTAYALVLANRTDDARKKIDWLMDHAQRNNSLLWWHKIGLFFSNFLSIQK